MHKYLTLVERVSILWAVMRLLFLKGETLKRLPSPLCCWQKYDDELVSYVAVCRKLGRIVASLAFSSLILPGSFVLFFTIFDLIVIIYINFAERR